MCGIRDPFNATYGTSTTEDNIANIQIFDLDKNEYENKNDYKTYFDKEVFEKHIEVYPKTRVEVKVLGYVPIPD